MSWGLVLSLAIAVVGVAFVSWQIVQFVQFQKKMRRAEEMVKEYRALGDELLDLKRQFDTKYADLDQDARSELWKPVSDEVIRSIEALTAVPLGDPVPALREAIRLAQEIVSRNA